MRGRGESFQGWLDSMVAYHMTHPGTPLGLDL